ncbi:ATPase [Pseudomonas sp. V1]|uniref:ATPase n=1 Tax=Pseudomonas arcuscaelestis TaxID=2710591 RepID=UPI00193F137D|nr:ATPase [Pseudomonas arcuscaelestis]MBM3105838.1 ATPase [Pseudomonas arcuscaelestis]
MQIETLNDVLHWVENYHSHLRDCLSHCASAAESERAALLLGYLADQEAYLAKLLAQFEVSADARALNTWCYEYLQRRPIERHAHCDKPFAELSPAQITEALLAEQSQIIELFQHLHDRAPTSTCKELLAQLLQLETHEARRMSHAANRLEDM